MTTTSMTILRTIQLGSLCNLLMNMSWTARRYWAIEPGMCRADSEE